MIKKDIENLKSLIEINKVNPLIDKLLDKTNKEIKIIISLFPNKKKQLKMFLFKNLIIFLKELHILKKHISF